ncbi:MAG: glutaredoxin family protein [Sedimenticola sp.]
MNDRLFTLYSRQGCHLCDDMRGQLQALGQELGFRFTEIDIAGDMNLEERFGTLIPVFAQGEHVICNYYLDPQAVRAILEKE